MAKTLGEYREILLNELGDDPVTPTIYTNEDLLNEWILYAVREVSKLRPKQLTTTITLVANTYRYDPPSNFLSIDRVTYRYTALLDSEIPISFAYEEYDKKINLTDISVPIQFQVGTQLTVYFSQEYTLPDETVNSTMPAAYDRAVVLFAAAAGIRWNARRLISFNRGVMEFSRARYSEKSGTNSLDFLINSAKSSEEEARNILNANDPAVFETRGINSSEYKPADFVDPVLTGSGYTGQDYSAGSRLSVPSKPSR